MGDEVWANRLRISPLSKPRGNCSQFLAEVGAKFAFSCAFGARFVVYFNEAVATYVSLWGFRS
jgi:hypothetical protein